MKMSLKNLFADEPGARFKAGVLMMTVWPLFRRRGSQLTRTALVWQLCQSLAGANPAGGSAAQGTASFTSSGSQLTVATSANAFINWQSFNIAAGETTTFAQPSSASVVWNRINDPNASQILGTLNANGYVVLQNPAGFYIGGAAAINTHGLIMTTAPTPMPDLSSGGAWQFNTPPRAPKSSTTARSTSPAAARFI